MGNHSSFLALASFASIAVAQDAVGAPAAARGCVWDQTGCTQGCDTSLMETRCGRLNHDMEACNGDEGKLSRCVWSHGEADRELEKDEDAAEFYSLGCIWDQTGCAQGCNVEAMLGRCSRYDHDMASCLGDDGQLARCQWGKYNDRMLAELEDLKLANLAEEQGAESEQEQLVEIEDEAEEDVAEDQEALQQDDEDEEQVVPDESQEQVEDMDAETEQVLSETFVDDGTDTVEGAAVLDASDCVWDETGCVGEFCSQVMGSRCSALSMMDCAADIGAFKRCKLQQRRQSATLFGLNVSVLDSEVSAVDTLLVIAGLLTSLVAVQQGFKYCKQRTNKQLVAREPQYGTIQLIDSHAEEAHV